MEVVLLLVLAVVVLAVGIRVGMLMAPRIERLADRANRVDAADPVADAPAEPSHEDDDDRTD